MAEANWIWLNLSACVLDIAAGRVE